MVSAAQSGDAGVRGQQVSEVGALHLPQQHIVFGPGPPQGVRMGPHPPQQNADGYPVPAQGAVAVEPGTG